MRTKILVPAIEGRADVWLNVTYNVSHVNGAERGEVMLARQQACEAFSKAIHDWSKAAQSDAERLDCPTPEVQSEQY